MSGRLGLAAGSSAHIVRRTPRETKRKIQKCVRADYAPTRAPPTRGAPPKVEQTSITSIMGKADVCPIYSQRELADNHPMIGQGIGIPTGKAFPMNAYRLTFTNPAAEKKAVYIQAPDITTAKRLLADLGVVVQGWRLAMPHEGFTPWVVVDPEPVVDAVPIPEEVEGFHYHPTGADAMGELDEITGSRMKSLELLGFARNNPTEEIKAYGAVVVADAMGFKVRRSAAEDCPGHPCDDDPERYPHAAIGEIAFCDGSCQRSRQPA